jgi:hypothetical protein
MGERAAGSRIGWATFVSGRASGPISQGILRRRIKHFKGLRDDVREPAEMFFQQGMKIS